MSAPVFTPGDWVADEHRLTIVTLTDEALDVAEVLDDGTCPPEQIKADLYLLAASKRLYFAAKEALNWHEAALTGRTTAENAFDVADSLKAALAAAEGR